ncbi:hypothetical protein [Mucilaginibacter hurinus]|nr:hypothetical protein [Mucilaginibacter hurinus]
MTKFTLTFAALCVMTAGLLSSCSKDNDDPEPVEPTICNIKAYNFLTPLASANGSVVYEVKVTGEATVSKITYYTAGMKKNTLTNITLPFKDSVAVNKNDSVALFVEGKAVNGKITATYRLKTASSTTNIMDECTGTRD